MRGSPFYSGDNIGGGSEFNKELNELQQLRLEMTKELRMMREDLKQAVSVSISNTSQLAQSINN